MSQPVYNVTEFGTNTTSTATFCISTGSRVVNSINVTSTGTGTVTFYNATTSSTGAEIAVLTVAAVASYYIEGECPNGLTRGGTSSTAEIMVTWA